MAEYAESISFVLAMLGLTGVLIWGLKKISKVMDADAGNGKSVLQTMVSEEAKPAAGAPAAGAPAAGAPAAADGPPKGSFSRITGAVGAMALAATFVGVGFWAIYALFYRPTNLNFLEQMGTYFLAGSALFMPYAFNKLSTVFKSG